MEDLKIQDQAQAVQLRSRPVVGVMACHGHVIPMSSELVAIGGRSCRLDPVPLSQDERLLIVHFMGGSKHLAPEVLCSSGSNYTGEVPEGYGCRH